MKIIIKRKSITKTVQLKIRCTEEEMKKLEKTARSHNLTVLEYIEKLLHNDIQIDLNNHKPKVKWTEEEIDQWMKDSFEIMNKFGFEKQLFGESHKIWHDIHMK